MSKVCKTCKGSGQEADGAYHTCTECNGSGFNCCKPTAEENALLKAGDCTPEELWGGPRPTCPKCIGGPVPPAVPPSLVVRLHALLNERDEKIGQLESAKAMALKWLAERDEAILKQKGLISAIRKIAFEPNAMAYSDAPEFVNEIRDLLDEG